MVLAAAIGVAFCVTSFHILSAHHETCIQLSVLRVDCTVMSATTSVYLSDFGLQYPHHETCSPLSVLGVHCAAVVATLFCSLGTWFLPAIRPMTHC